MSIHSNAEPDDSHPVPAGAITPVAPREPTHSTSNPLLAAIPYVVGVVALLAYALFVTELLRDSRVMSDQHWLRALHLLTGVESIAFAAAGFFFGREVNRARAEQAEAHARTETRRKEKAVARAVDAETRGVVLAREVKELADIDRGAGEMADGFAPSDPRLARVAAQARRLFPHA